MIENPSLTITQYVFGRLLGRVYNKILHPKYAIHTFKACGLVSLDPTKFSEEDYRPSEIVDQSLEIAPEPATIMPLKHDEDFQFPDKPNEPLKVANSVLVDQVSLVRIIESLDQDKDLQPVKATHRPVDVNGKHVFPQEIHPLPKIRKLRTRSTRDGNSLKLTSRPVKHW